MNKKIQLAVVVLLVVVAFLTGTVVAKSRYGNQEGLKTDNNQEKQTVDPAPAPFVPPKSAVPEVKFFVMSFCPYGNQAEDGLEPVYQLLKNKVSWQPRYIIDDKKKSCETGCPYRVFNDEAKARCDEAIKQGQVKDLETCKTYFPYSSAEECLSKECALIKEGEYNSLHGQVELNQNIREICAFNLGDLDKWWQFVLLTNEKCNSTDADSCWKQQAQDAGLSVEKISTCEKAQTRTLAEKEISETEKYQASGSPTVLINNEVYNGGRSPEDYKKAICSAFENQPEECAKVLGEESAAVNSGCE